MTASHPQLHFSSVPRQGEDPVPFQRPLFRAAGPLALNPTGLARQFLVVIRWLLLEYLLLLPGFVIHA